MEDISKMLRFDIKAEDLEQESGILCCMSDLFVSRDNQKYMKVYDWTSFFYDFGEKWIGKLECGDAINHLRTELVSRLEWRNNISVFYVSIGTGADLRYIPQEIDLKTIELIGTDISMGMPKKYKKEWQKQTNLTLVQCSAEELLFVDNTFDVVFHNGSINFFNDKAFIINEMLRVAKTGSKLPIADETADSVESQYKKSLFPKSYFKDKTVDLNVIEKCIPVSVAEKKIELFWDNKSYSVTFRKPI